MGAKELMLTSVVVLTAAWPQEVGAQVQVRRRGLSGALTDEKVDGVYRLKEWEKQEIEELRDTYDRMGFSVGALRNAMTQNRFYPSAKSRARIDEELDNLSDTAVAAAREPNEQKDKMLRKGYAALRLVQQIVDAEEASKSFWTWNKKYYEERARALAQQLRDDAAKYQWLYGDRPIYVQSSPDMEGNGSVVDGGYGLGGAMKAAMARERSGGGLQATGDEDLFNPLGLAFKLGNFTARKVLGELLKDTAQSAVQTTVEGAAEKLIDSSIKSLQEDALRASRGAARGAAETQTDRTRESMERRALNASRRRDPVTSEGLTIGPRLSPYGRGLMRGNRGYRVER